jgi:hypothetical protein
LVIFVGPPHSVQDFIQASSRGGRGAANPRCKIVSVCHEESSNYFFQYCKEQAKKKANGASLMARYEEIQLFWRNFRDLKVCVRQLLLVLQTCDSATNGYCSANDENQKCYVCLSLKLSNNFLDRDSSNIMKPSSNENSPYILSSQSSSEDHQSTLSTSFISSNNMISTVTTIDETSSSIFSPVMKKKRKLENSNTECDEEQNSRDFKKAKITTLTRVAGDYSLQGELIRHSSSTANIDSSTSTLFHSGSIVRVASKNVVECEQNQVNAMIHDEFANLSKHAAAIKCYSCFTLNTRLNPAPHSTIKHQACLPKQWFNGNKIPFICFKSLNFNTSGVYMSGKLPCCKDNTHLKDRFSILTGYCRRCTLPNKDHTQSIHVLNGQASSQHSLGSRCSFLAYSNSENGDGELDAEFVFGMVNLIYLAGTVNMISDSANTDFARAIALTEGGHAWGSDTASFFGQGSSFNKPSYSKYCDLLLESHPYHREYLRISFLIKEIISLRSKGRLIFKK